MNHHVIQIEAGLPLDRNLMGGKALSLVKLLDLEAAVPPAFVLTTDAYRGWVANPGESMLAELLTEGLRGLENRAGKRLTGGPEGLIVSVRSGAPISMPGMMDTVLNVGSGPIASGAEPFFYDARRRFLLQFAQLVVGLDKLVLDDLRRTPYGNDPAEATASLEQALLRQAVREGKIWPTSPFQELVGAAEAVFASWQSSRAKLYRRIKKIDDSIGTTVTVQQMVFGNRDANSGSGVAFTRNPTSGDPGLSGEFVFRGQGEEVVSGTTTGADLSVWSVRQPEQFRALDALGKRLEVEEKKIYEIEFTVECGEFYVLQCRPARLTKFAAVRCAMAFHDERLLSPREALDYAIEHGFDPGSSGKGLSIRLGSAPVAVGLPVGGGVGVGRVAFDSSGVDRFVAAGDPAVFIAIETSPSLLSLMKRCVAMVTMHGGATSHAAVVAREIGTPCVVGVGGHIEGRRARLGAILEEGDWVTIDGDSGSIYAGQSAEETVCFSEAELRLRAMSDGTAVSPAPNRGQTV